ncbi:MAG: peptidyl-prolyl cis-trans isomerase [Planctomycetota bacterium]
MQALVASICARARPRLACALGLTAVLVLGGCASDPEPAGAALDPQDFVDPTAPRLDAPPERWVRVSAEGPGGEGETLLATARAAKVGQINGRPVYADQVLEPLADRLRAMGRNAPRTFDRDASQAIFEALGAQLSGALIVAEAEASLSANQRLGLDYFLAEQREEMIRLYGQGSGSMADRVLREREGLGLDAKIDQFRKQQLVLIYRRNRIDPGVNVARRDIERFYRDYQDRYVRPERRWVRVIVAGEGPDADDARARLDSGEAFLDVASDPLNAYRPGEGGLWSKPVTGADFASTEVNQAAQSLAVGEHAGPFEVRGDRWWVYVDRVEPGFAKPLSEVQHEIEFELTRGQIARLEIRDRRRLLANASHTDLRLMTQRILEIAKQRYGPA